MERAVDVITSLPLPRFGTRSVLATRARIDMTIGFAFGLTAFGLYLYGLGPVSLWGDEVYSIGLAQTSWDAFLRLVSGTQSNMALFYLVLRGWLSIFEPLGVTQSDLLVRLPSLVFAALTVILVFRLGLRISGRFVGSVAAVLYMVNFVALSLSGEVRSYSMELFLVCLSWYYFLPLLNGRSGARPWLTYGFVGALAVLAHLFSVFIVASQVLAYATMIVLDPPSRHRLWRSAPALMASLFIVSVAAVPLLLLGITHLGPEGRGAGATGNLTEAARALWNLSGHNLLYGALVGAAAIVGVIFLRNRGWRLSPPTDSDPDRSARSNLVALVSWLAVTPLLSFIASSPPLNQHVFSYRYLVVVVPALVILAGVGVRAISVGHRTRLAAAVLLIAAALPALPLYHSTVLKQDYRSASLWIGQRYEAGDGLICASWSCGPAMAHYLRGDRSPAELAAEALGQYSWSVDRITPVETTDLALYLATHTRVFLVHAPLALDRLQEEARAASTEAWLRSNSLIISEARFDAYYGPVVVQLYARK
jgi:uncharacterized membrane protein